MCLTFSALMLLIDTKQQNHAVNNQGVSQSDEFTGDKHDSLSPHRWLLFFCWCCCLCRCVENAITNQYMPMLKRRNAAHLGKHCYPTPGAVWPCRRRGVKTTRNMVPSQWKPTLSLPDSIFSIFFFVFSFLYVFFLGVCVNFRYLLLMFNCVLCVYYGYLRLREWKWEKKTVCAVHSRGDRCVSVRMVVKPFFFTLSNIIGAHSMAYKLSVCVWCIWDGERQPNVY